MRRRVRKLPFFEFRENGPGLSTTWGPNTEPACTVAVNPTNLVRIWICSRTSWEHFWFYNKTLLPATALDSAV